MRGLFFILPNEPQNLASLKLNFRAPSPTKSDASFPFPSSFMFCSLQRLECQLFNSFKNCSSCQIHSRVHLWLSLAILTASHHKPLTCPPVPLWVSGLSSPPPASSWIRSVLPSIARPHTHTSMA